MRQRKLLPYALFLVTATSAQNAFADISIGAEAGFLYTLTRASDDRFGFGFAGRLGYDIDLSILHLIPEIKVAYDRVPLDINVNVLRPMVGLRATIGIAFLAIVGFAHVGYGAPLGYDGQLDASGVVYEFGGGIDFTSIPIIDIGIWGSWSQVRTPNFYDWLGVGASLTITI